MNLPLLMKHMLRHRQRGPKESLCRQIATEYDFDEFERIYHVHIRKTGGTSLNNMFLALSGEDPALLYAQLGETRGHRLISNGKIYVGWNIRHINKGYYFYGYSHTPVHMLDLPPNTFTITCFRDPVKRVLSHYNMLLDFQKHNSKHPCMATEGAWLGNSFKEFLQCIPKRHLLNQLYMFSEQMDISTAVAKATKLSHILFTEHFNEGINELNNKARLHLQPVHIRKTGTTAQIPATDISELREMLDPEYQFLETVATQHMPQPTPVRSAP